MEVRRKVLLAATLMLAACPLLSAATLTYSINGTVGPILAGSDPLGANGESGTITMKVSNTLTPTSTTSTSATYTLPAGAITVNIGGTNYPTTGTSTLEYTIPASGHDTMVITTKVNVSGINGTVVGTISLAHGSFKSTILTHPTKFSPTTQNLTAATSTTGPGSKVKYTVPLLGSSTLGFSGTASN